MTAAASALAMAPVRSRARPDGWLLAALAIAAVALLPLLALAWTAAQGSDAWPHILANVLPQAARNTLWLLLGVGALSVAIGTGSAWLVTGSNV